MLATVGLFGVVTGVLGQAGLAPVCNHDAIATPGTAKSKSLFFLFLFGGEPPPSASRISRHAGLSPHQCFPKNNVAAAARGLVVLVPIPENSN